MDDPRENYKCFIDGLLQRSGSVGARSMREKRLYEIPDQESQARDMRSGFTDSVQIYERFTRHNILLESLTEEQRSMIADLLQSEKQAGMEAVLVYLADGKYQLLQDGIALPFEPFDTSYQYDFISRAAGDTWPDEKPKS